jgi:protein O-mannosyl-transferase
VIARLSRADLLWLAAIVAGLLVIYLPGLDSALVFDDAQLASGELLAQYATPELRARMLSYGSFVWLQALVGEGWWKQRIANLAIHVAVVVALWGLYREILRHIALPPADGSHPAGAPVEPYEKSPALGLAIGLFALNPVAVYAVAYLIQRSILLATLFVVVGLWLFARGLASGKPLLHVLAAGSYVLALASKEYAILAPIAAIPLYVLIARPSGKRLASLAAASALLVGAAGLALLYRYGEILGTPFDEYSHIYLAQLAKLNPDALKYAYPLSIMNQAYLFFEYGLRWFIPFTEWMSINLRPPFPVTWLTFPHLLGIVGYLGTIAAGFHLVIRYRDWRALIGISLLLPALLFATEFATVWVQDPFVLYRSYLWAIGLPGIVFFFLHGLSARALAALGLVMACFLGWEALDRVFSMTTAERVYSDAIDKLPNDPRAVGRWFPYLNRGNAYFDLGKFALAERDFEMSAALGDGGMGMFNVGALRLQAGKPREALAAFDKSAQDGYNLFNLPFERGMALSALGKTAEAHAQFATAMAMKPTSPTREVLQLQLGRTALQLGRHDEALGHLENLLATDPSNKEARYLLAMALIGKDGHARASAILDKLLAEDPNASAYYARALANYGLKRKAEARSDIDNAIRLGLDNPDIRGWQAKIGAMP